MVMITEWVTQIIVFILIATIIELLIPNNSMKKYINIVIALLLLVILAKPILYIFQIDVASELDNVENRLLQTNVPTIDSESDGQTKKIEIQAEQVAYIWNEVKLTLMEEANTSLKEIHNAQITDIAFIFQDEPSINFEELKNIVITLNKTTKIERADGLIVPVHINTEERTPEQTEQDQDDQIKLILEQRWDVDKEMIQLIWEGGTF